MLGSQGFDPAREIEGIVVNRWPHGYAFEPNPLLDPEMAPGEAPTRSVASAMDVSPSPIPAQVRAPI
jgi:spermidine dehydrogenase